MARMARRPLEPGISGPSTQLTKRERQIADLVRQGLSSKLIARKLNVTEGTIKSHLHAIYIKLGVQSRGALKRAS
jgi:two-component system, NarL family, nitrate/nitrite response regulator NarL